eukprot:GHVU01006006.1.p1 GENE.GHVU01006006.1~~GHVU01006006.1.p1  ORF type:complete len:185 (-),score=14.47 GHVU01006006.1:18-572(-)
MFCALRLASFAPSLNSLVSPVRTFCCRLPHVPVCRCMSGRRARLSRSMDARGQPTKALLAAVRSPLVGHFLYDCSDSERFRENTGSGEPAAPLECREERTRRLSDDAAACAACPPAAERGSTPRDVCSQPPHRRGRRSEGTDAAAAEVPAIELTRLCMQHDPLHPPQRRRRTRNCFPGGSRLGP